MVSVDAHQIALSVGEVTTLGALGRWGVSMSIGDQASSDSCRPFRSHQSKTVDLAQAEFVAGFLVLSVFDFPLLVTSVVG